MSPLAGSKSWNRPHAAFSARCKMSLSAIEAALSDREARKPEDTGDQGLLSRESTSPSDFEGMPVRSNLSNCHPRAAIVSVPIEMNAARAYEGRRSKERDELRILEAFKRAEEKRDGESARVTRIILGSGCPPTEPQAAVRRPCQSGRIRRWPHHGRWCQRPRR